MCTSCNHNNWCGWGRAVLGGVFTRAGAYLVQGLQCCVSLLQPLSHLHLNLSKLNVLYLHISTAHHTTSAQHTTSAHHTTSHQHSTSPHQGRTKYQGRVTCVILRTALRAPTHPTPPHPTLPRPSGPPAAPGYPAVRLSCPRVTRNNAFSSAAI